MSERERIARSVAGGCLVAAVVAALMAGCSQADESDPCEQHDRVDFIAVAAVQPPAPRPPAPAPRQNGPSLKKPAAPASPPTRREPRAEVPGAPRPAASPTAPPSPSSIKQKRRHLDVDFCDD
ncbi:hypothetical protein [Streptomyces californicus]|uniref:hypothetical protein n=1 Tax=Streptomyces californicus TaxID=67351 RepID=UPI00381B4646